MFSSACCFCVFISLLLHEANAIDCGLPGRPHSGSVNLTSENKDHYPPGTVVSYSCPDPHFILKGHHSHRTCQENGKWSGFRPWCDMNAAYGKKVVFLNDKKEREEPSVTDGNTRPSDDQNCPSLNPGNSSALQIELTNSYSIKSIILHSQDELHGTGQVFIDEQECRKSEHKCERSMQFDCYSSKRGYHRGHSFKGQKIRFLYLGDAPLRICEVEASNESGIIQIFSRVPEAHDWNSAGFECGEPEVPANSHVTIAKRGSFKFVYYECVEGYQLIGQAKRTCYGIHWQGEQPICKPLVTELAANPLTDVTFNSTTQKADLITSGINWTTEDTSVLLIITFVIFLFSSLITLGFYMYIRHRKSNGVKTESSGNIYENIKNFGSRSSILQSILLPNLLD